jgi:hypothetical protein
VSFYFWCNNAAAPGRICEVGPPASGSSFFTKPLFALRAQREPIGNLMPRLARALRVIGWHGLLLAAGMFGSGHSH